MKIQRLLLLGAVLCTAFIYPAILHAATSTNETTQHSSHQMDMSEPAGTAAGSSMPGHTMDTTADTKPASGTPVHNMDEMTADEMSAMPGHNMAAPGHGSSGAGTVRTEVNRAGLLGGFALLNGFVILGAAILKRKKSAAAGGGINGS